MFYAPPDSDCSYSHYGREYFVRRASHVAFVAWPAMDTLPRQFWNTRRTLGLLKRHHRLKCRICPPRHHLSRPDPRLASSLCNRCVYIIHSFSSRHAREMVPRAFSQNGSTKPSLMGLVLSCQRLPFVVNRIQ